MNSQAFHFDSFDVRDTDIRETNVGFTLEPSAWFRHLPPADLLTAPLEVVAGAFMLLASAGLIAATGGAGSQLLPILTLVLVVVTFAMALDAARVWLLAVASIQLTVLAPAGYLLASGVVSLPWLVAMHALLTTVLLLDYRALRQAPMRVWLGAEAGLLIFTLL